MTEEDPQNRWGMSDWENFDWGSGIGNPLHQSPRPAQPPRIPLAGQHSNTPIAGIDPDEDGDVE